MLSIKVKSFSSQFFQAIIRLILLVLFLSACSAPAPAPTPLPPKATEAPTTPAPIDTPTSEPSATPTPEPTRTLTPAPLLESPAVTPDLSTTPGFIMLVKSTFMGITFIIEKGVDQNNPQDDYLRTEGGTDSSANRYAASQFDYVADPFPSHYITDNLADDLSNPSLEDGLLAASINPQRNPETDGIDLAYKTKGEITWCGMQISASGAQDQMVLLGSLKWGQNPAPWSINVPAAWLNQLATVEETGWAESVFEGVVSPGSSQKTELQPKLVLHASQDYVLVLLPNAQTNLGGDSSLLPGNSHQYLVRGYVCPTAGSGVFTPAMQLKVSYVEKIR